MSQLTYFAGQRFYRKVQVSHRRGIAGWIHTRQKKRELKRNGRLGVNNEKNADNRY